jgi:pimeloyl-ACP methyl ester carboxylesterase
VTEATTGVVPTEGAEIYFERRGAGPAMLLIAGGGGDCGVFDRLADRLADTHTVLSYDRRGNSRSPLRRPPRRITIAEQSADAAAVIRANGFESALVFGNSGGATVALDLAAHHPQVVVAAVPHEPPVPRILPDAVDILARYDEIDRVRRTDGWQTALARFLAENGLAPERPEILAAIIDPVRFLPPGPMLDEMRRENGNWEYMMEFEVPPFVAYEPDWTALAEGKVPIAIGAGAETRNEIPHRAGVAVAERLGVALVEFPGDHVAPATIPGLFAPELRSVFQELVTADPR